MTGQELVEAGYFQISKRFRCVARLPPGKSGIDALTDAAKHDRSDARAWAKKLGETRAADYYIRCYAKDEIVLDQATWDAFVRAGGCTVDRREPHGGKHECLCDDFRREHPSNVAPKTVAALTGAQRETWHAFYGGELKLEDKDDYLTAKFDRRDGYDEDRAKLASVAPELLRLVIGVVAASVTCPWCGSRGGHLEDCSFSAILHKAGVL